MNSKPITNEYLSKFNIYCLIKRGKDWGGSIDFRFEKRVGFKDEYFENKIDYLLGYTYKNWQLNISKSIFDFYLAHKTNPNFKFEPDDKTDKIIWKYLSTANLLSSFKEIETTEFDKISKYWKSST